MSAQAFRIDIANQLRSRQPARVSEHALELSFQHVLQHLFCVPATGVRFGYDAFPGPIPGIGRIFNLWFRRVADLAQTLSHFLLVAPARLMIRQICDIGVF